MPTYYENNTHNFRLKLKPFFKPKPIQTNQLFAYSLIKQYKKLIEVI